MVDRSYLPYKSAREYRDRKMAKWMGFFLSEHTTALNSINNIIDFNQILDTNKKILLLNQLYIHHLIAKFNLNIDGQLISITGTVHSLINDQIGLYTEDGYSFIYIHQVISIYLKEDEFNDS